MSRLTPYFLFAGNCAEAMQFYQACFGGELTITRVGDSPMKAQYPEALHARVINASLTSRELFIAASDWLHPTRQPVQGNRVCAYVNGASYEELAGYFERLSDGAPLDLIDPLREMPFGTYGALTDRYGVRWMFQGERRPESATGA